MWIWKMIACGCIEQSTYNANRKASAVVAKEPEIR